MKSKAIFIALIFSYVLVLVPFTAYLKKRPVAVKLGYVPDAAVLKVIAGEHRFALAQSAVVRVLIYYGTLLENARGNVLDQPEYYNMYKTLETAVKLDPYNMDAYYFTQAAFTWEVGRIKEVNRMLQYGMRYRTWDYFLPFYAAFNYAYFLKDYKNAALYMKRAAEISGDPLFTNLTARFLYESRQNDLGILFLDMMEKGAKDKGIKKAYEIRKAALLAVKEISGAVERFRGQYNRSPRDLRELIASGVLTKIPADPYGGTFYLADDGMVRSTSKFAFRSGQK